MPDDGGAPLDPAARLRLSLEPVASPGDVDVVQRGLLAFNEKHIGDPAAEAVHVFARDASGSIGGGLIGQIRWRWLYVATLWVAERWRGQGYGAALLAAAEDHARTRQCLGVHLDTFDYQARPFYEKHGYELFGTLEGYPPGHRQYHLAKRLDS